MGKQRPIQAPKMYQICTTEQKGYFAPPNEQSDKLQKNHKL